MRSEMRSLHGQCISTVTAIAVPLGTEVPAAISCVTPWRRPRHWLGKLEDQGPAAHRGLRLRHGQVDQFRDSFGAPAAHQPGVRLPTPVVRPCRCRRWHPWRASSSWSRWLAQSEDPDSVEADGVRRAPIAPVRRSPTASRVAVHRAGGQAWTTRQHQLERWAVMRADCQMTANGAGWECRSNDVRRERREWEESDGGPRRPAAGRCPCGLGGGHRQAVGGGGGTGRRWALPGAGAAAGRAGRAGTGAPGRAQGRLAGRRGRSGSTSRSDCRRRTRSGSASPTSGPRSAGSAGASGRGSTRWRPRLRRSSCTSRSTRGNRGPRASGQAPPVRGARARPAGTPPTV
jgi:hypothetical protein